MADPKKPKESAESYKEVLAAGRQALKDMEKALNPEGQR